MRTISSMTKDLRSLNEEAWGLIDRVRRGNRSMTGYTGEVPTDNSVGLAPTTSCALDALNVAIADIGNAITALRAEVTHMEGYTETGDEIPVLGQSAQGAVAQQAKRPPSDTRIWLEQ